jgi:hypothetical protein
MASSAGVTGKAAFVGASRAAVDARGGLHAIFERLRQIWNRR